MKTVLVATIVAAGLIARSDFLWAGAGCRAANGAWYADGSRLSIRAALGYETRSAVPVFVRCRDGRWVAAPR